MPTLIAVPAVYAAGFVAALARGAWNRETGVRETSLWHALIWPYAAARGLLWLAIAWSVYGVRR